MPVFDVEIIETVAVRIQVVADDESAANSLANEQWLSEGNSAPGVVDFSVRERVSSAVELPQGLRP